MPEEIKVRCHNGMVDIDSKSIAYGNIRNMYKSGNGVGIQISPAIDGKKALKLCNTISDALYELNDMLEAMNENL